MKLRLFFQRLFDGGSLKRFFANIENVHREFGTCRFVLFFDMLWCALFKGVGHLEYVIFGFAGLDRAHRKTFQVMGENYAMAKRLNDPAYMNLFEDKLLFNPKFAPYLHREFFILTESFDEANLAEFAAFCARQPVFFAKEGTGSGGDGVRKIKVEEFESIEALYRELQGANYRLAEEAIRQHPAMNEFCARSVNTLRAVTVVGDSGAVTHVYTLLRIGRGNADVDNICQGGMYTLLSEDGVTVHPFYCDAETCPYSVHPETGNTLTGRQVPYFDEVKRLVKELALVEPHMRYIGWDIAVTEDGPVVVEGNPRPGHAMWQHHLFHEDGIGSKAILAAAEHK